MDDESLEQQALDEILKETKKSAERAKEMGAFGWTKHKPPSTNKMFLQNMLVSTLRNIDSPKSRNRASGRENNREHYDIRKRRHDHSVRHEDRDYKDSYCSKRERRSSGCDQDRAQKNSKRKHKKEKKTKSDKHKLKHSKSKKSKKKHKSKRKEAKEES